MLCVLSWPVLSWFRLFVVILRLFNFCLLNLFIYFVLGYHIRWWNKVVYINFCRPTVLNYPKSTLSSGGVLRRWMVGIKPPWLGRQEIFFHRVILPVAYLFLLQTEETQRAVGRRSFREIGMLRSVRGYQSSRFRFLYSKYISSSSLLLVSTHAPYFKLSINGLTKLSDRLLLFSPA